MLFVFLFYPFLKSKRSFPTLKTFKEVMKTWPLLTIAELLKHSQFGDLVTYVNHSIIIQLCVERANLLFSLAGRKDNSCRAVLNRFVCISRKNSMMILQKTFNSEESNFGNHIRKEIFDGNTVRLWAWFPPEVKIFNMTAILIKNLKCDNEKLLFKRGRSVFTLPSNLKTHFWIMKKSVHWYPL